MTLHNHTDPDASFVITYHGKIVQRTVSPSPLVGEGGEVGSINQHRAGEGISTRICASVFVSMP
jgi:hypothetical protein